MLSSKKNLFPISESVLYEKCFPWVEKSEVPSRPRST